MPSARRAWQSSQTGQAEKLITAPEPRAGGVLQLHPRPGRALTILDLGGANQENVNFITNLGHKLYSEDFLQLPERDVRR